MTPFSSLLDGFEARTTEHAAKTGPYVEGAAFVRGAFVPAAEATVPLFDYGFLRSDLTYDVPAVWNGRFFRLDDHLARLEQSCAKLRLTPPGADDKIYYYVSDGADFQWQGEPLCDAQTCARTRAAPGSRRAT